ncbi:MAG: hypothetical protein AAB225_23985 [Acidobacteriota bacterium]
MNTQPSREDAHLILRIYDLRNQDKLQKAREWLLTLFQARDMDEFREVCPPSWETYADFHRAVSFWQMVASFLTSGVLHATLFFQTDLELLAVWERIHHLVPELRAAANNPGLYRDLEVAAGMARRYLAGLGTAASAASLPGE